MGIIFVFNPFTGNFDAINTGGTPASPTNSIQYNNAGTFGGSANATLDSSGNASFLGSVNTNLVHNLGAHSNFVVQGLYALTGGGTAADINLNPSKTFVDDGEGGSTLIDFGRINLNANETNLLLNLNVGTGAGTFGTLNQRLRYIAGSGVTTGKLGVNNDNPLVSLHVVDVTSASQYFDTYSVGGSPNPLYAFRTSRGYPGSESAVQSGDSIGFIGARAWGTTGFGASSGAGIQFLATENQTDTAHGSSAVIGTTPNGSTTRTDRVKIDQNGAMSVLGLTSNGFVKTSGGTGLLSVDTTTYLPSSSFVPAGQTGDMQYNNAGVFAASNLKQLSTGNAEFYVPSSAVGSEQTLYPTFGGGYGYWFHGTGWAGSSTGVYATKNANGVGTFGQVQSYFNTSVGPLTVGLVYRCQFTLSSVTVPDALTVSIAGNTFTKDVSGNIFSAAGTYTFYFVALNNTGALTFTPTVSTSRFYLSAPSIKQIGGNLSVGGTLSGSALTIGTSPYTYLSVDNAGAHFPLGLDANTGNFSINTDSTIYSQPFSSYTSNQTTNTTGGTPSNGGIQFGTDGFHIIEDGDAQGGGMAFIMGAGGEIYTKFTNSGDLSLPGYILDQVDGDTPAIYPSNRWLIGSDGTTTVLDWSGNYAYFLSGAASIDASGNMSTRGNFTVGDNMANTIMFQVNAGTSVQMGDPTLYITGNYFLADPYQMYWWNNAGGHPSFTVSGDSVTTWNNTLDDGAGGAIFQNMSVSGYYNVGGSANANEFKIGGTTVIDPSRNATFTTMNGTIGDLISTGKRVGALIQKTSNYTIAAGDSLVIMGANGATATLPTAASSTGRIITVKTASYSGGSNTLGTAGGNIDGAATVALAIGKSRTVQSDGTYWHVIGGVF